MDDMISRSAAIEICKSIVPNTNPDFYNLKSKAGYGSWMHSNGEVCAISNIETKIEELPAVDAAPVVHGRWVHLDPRECATISGKCSCCGWEAHYYEDDVADMPYCPNCGAKMDGEADG